LAVKGDLGTLVLLCQDMPDLGVLQRTWILFACFAASDAFSELGSVGCTDHGGCADQFDGLGACVNLAAPLQISELFNRFDLSTTSIKGLCGNAGCCHCLKVIDNAIGGPKNPNDKEPSAKKPSAKRPKRKKVQKPKSKKRKTKKQKRKKPKLKKPKTLKPKGKKSISG